MPSFFKYLPPHSGSIVDKCDCGVTYFADEAPEAYYDEGELDNLRKAPLCFGMAKDSIHSTDLPLIGHRVFGCIKCHWEEGMFKLMKALEEPMVRWITDRKKEAEAHAEEMAKRAAAIVPAPPGVFTLEHGGLTYDCSAHHYTLYRGNMPVNNWTISIVYHNTPEEIARKKKDVDRMTKQAAELGVVIEATTENGFIIKE